MATQQAASVKSVTAPTAAYTVKTLVKRNGKYFKAGAPLTLTAKEAAHLLKAKAIAPVAN